MRGAFAVCVLLCTGAVAQLLPEASGDGPSPFEEEASGAGIDGSGVEPKPAAAAPKPVSFDECPPKLDVVFLLDTSGSIKRIYQEHVKWTVTLVDTLPVDKDSVRVAAVQYAGFPLTEFALGTYPKGQDIREHLEKMEFRSGVTRTGDALRRAETELFRSDRGGRTDAAKVIVLFTDGLSIDDPLKPAIELRNIKSVKIYVVGLSPEGFMAEMDGIAGNKQRVFGPNDLARLRSTLLRDVEEARGCSRIGGNRPENFSEKKSAEELPVLQPIDEENNNLQEIEPGRNGIPVAFDLKSGAVIGPEPKISLEPENVIKSTTLEPPTSENGNNIITITVFNGDESKSTTSQPQDGSLSTEKQAASSPGVSPGSLITTESVPVISESVASTANKSLVPKIIQSEAPATARPVTSTTRKPTTRTTRKSTTPTTRKATTPSTRKPSTRKAITPSTRKPSTRKAITPSTRKLTTPTTRRSTTTKPSLRTNRAPAITAKTTIRTTSRPRLTSTRSPFSKAARQQGVTARRIQQFERLVVEPSNGNLDDNQVNERVTGRRTTVRTPTLRTTIRTIDFEEEIPITEDPQLRARLNARGSGNLPSGSCPLDILFILDSSGSVQNVYNDQKSFIQSVLNEVAIGERDHRVALLQFAGGELQKTEWSFDTFEDKSLLQTAFNEVRHFTGTTYIGAALTHARQLLDSRRKNVRTIVLLVSDGYSQDDPEPAAEVIRQIGQLKMYAISLAKLNNVESLSQLAGGREQVFVGEQEVESLKRILRSEMACSRRV